MNIFEFIADKITWHKINSGKITLEDYPDTEFLWRGISHGLILIISCLFIASLMGIFWESLLVLVVLQIVRSCINGIHFDLTLCYFVSVFLVLISGLAIELTTKLNYDLLYIFFLLSIWLIKHLHFWTEDDEILLSDKEIRDKYINIIIVLLGISWATNLIGLLWITNGLAITMILVVLTSKNWLKSPQGGNHE